MRRRPAITLIILTCMVATAINCAVQGLLGVPVTVEADVANGLPSFVIVEPTGRAIQEARERIIRASVRNAGFEFLPAAGDGESTGSM